MNRSPAPQRDPWLDNTKMVLVTLVVVGHALGLLADSVAGGWVYNFLYFWHIPAFVLVTGYFSRSFRWDRPHLLALVTTVALPYLLFEPALYYFRHALGQVDTGHLWLIPHWAMWYLPVLFMWRLATPVLRLHWLVLPVAVVLSLVGGLWSGQVLCFARALGLLPFFVLGLMLSKSGLDWLDRPWVRRTAVAALLGIFVLSRFTDEWARTAFLYYDAGYDDLGYQTLPAMWIRLVVMLIGVVGALSAIALVSRSRGWFTAMGGATMVVYLFHGFPLRLVEWLGWTGWATDHLLVGLVLTVAGAAAIALALAAPPVRRLLAWAVDPVGSWRRSRARRRADATPEPATGDRPNAMLAPPGPGPRR